MSPGPSRYGILGGTFDPVHSAHVALAQLMIAELALDHIAVIPSGLSWQKAAVETSTHDRMAMLSLAFAPLLGRISIDERELHRAGPSYTVDTLIAMREELGAEVALILIIGSDQLLRLDTWSRWEDVFELAHVAVAGRPGFPSVPEKTNKRLKEVLHDRLKPQSAAFSAPSGDLVTIAADLGDVSSSHIRTLAAEQQYGDLAALVPAAVLDYIRGNKLYRT